jgi:hypothetical protein
MTSNRYDVSNRKNQSTSDNSYSERAGKHFDEASGLTLSKLRNFPRFVPRQSLALFLARNEIFKNLLGVHGSIIECGVFLAGGLFTWAQLSAIYEPINHNRKVVGFDTFEGFPSIEAADQSNDRDSLAIQKIEGGYCFSGIGELRQGIELFDLNRPVGHIEKIQLVPGDATVTIPKFIEENPHIVVSCLHLDFDLHSPSVTALRHFLPRMPRGAMLVFDELNHSDWPGETLAVLEEVGLRRLKICRFSYTPQLSYAILD